MISKNRKGLISRAASGKAAGLIRIIAFFGVVMCACAGTAHAVASGVTITYDGKGAGPVTFDGTVHAKRLSCADCHEPRLLLPPLYEKKKGSEQITMHKITQGQSCGSCHEVSMTNYLSCSKCHHNK